MQLPFSVEVEYVADDPVNNIQGSGLGVRIPALPLAEGLNLELGLLGLEGILGLDYVGLDPTRPAGSIALLTYQDLTTSFTFGKARLGVQADFRVREPLAPWLGASFGINNRHWRRGQDFLHEGYLLFDMTAPPVTSAVGTLQLSGTAVTAASSQRLGETPVTGLRLITTGRAQFNPPETAIGRFQLVSTAGYYRYPVQGKTQVSFRFTPSWTLEQDPVRASFSYDHQFTDSGSPFGTTLDRLAPIHLVTGNLTVAGSVAENASGTVSGSVRYNVVRASPLEHLSFALSGSTVLGDWTFTPTVQLETAGLFRSQTDLTTAAFIQTDVGFATTDLEFGALVRYNFVELTGAPASPRLELRAGFPVVFERATMLPFVALNVAPLVNTGEFPAVYGHGLELRWQEGNERVRVGYRSYGEQFTTTLAVDVLGTP